jgi:hypothetical protein
MKGLKAAGSSSYWTLGLREAISLAPRLQPGGQVLKNVCLEPFPTVSLFYSNKNR